MIELLRYICEELERKGIEYMLSGSLAMSAYVTPRFTRDIDIIINLKKENLDEFLKIFSTHFYLNKEAIFEEVDREGMFNIIDQESGYKIDFVVKKNNPFRNEEFKRKQNHELFGFKAWIVSPEDLILSKFIWIQDITSDIQLQDIKNLLDHTNTNKEYIKTWIKTLNLKTYNLI
mgnify:CR=1 FL=1